MIDKISFKNLKKYKVLVVGDIMLDNYVFGNSNRLSPEAPVPVVNFISERTMLGGCGNVLRNLNSFDLSYDILSIIGDDLNGKKLQNELINLGVDLKGVIICKNRPTTEKKRIISGTHQLVRIDTESTDDISSFEEDKLLDRFFKIINGYNLVILSDYAKGVLTKKVCFEIINKCNSLGIKVLVDPKSNDFSKYAKANLIKPNLSEAQAVIGKKISSQESMIETSNYLKKRFEIENIVITLGEKGIFYSSNENGIVSGIKTSIFDVSGAGDTVLASLALCLCLSLSLKDSVVFANAAASLVIQEFGSEVTTIDKILNQLNYEGKDIK